MTHLRATIHSLCDDVLIAIVKQVALQDKAFRLFYTPCSDGHTPLNDPHANVRITDYHGRGCYALMLVSKQFHYLAVPFVFETLTSKGAARPLFRYKLLAKYRRFIRILVLDDGTPQEHEAAILSLSSLSSFCSLRRLEIFTKALTSTFPTHYGENESNVRVVTVASETNNLLFESHQEIAKRVTEVKLTQFNAAHHVSILESFTVVRHLELSNGKLLELHKDQEGKLEVALVPTLRKLHHSTTFLSSVYVRMFDSHLHGACPNLRSFHFEAKAEPNSEIVVVASEKTTYFSKATRRSRNV